MRRPAARHVCATIGRMPLGEFDLIATLLHAPGATRRARRRRRLRAAGAGAGPCSWRCRATCWSKAATSCPPSPPERLGHKALAVNLSDLAACGARPLAFTLALALPRVDEAFLDGFARRPVRAGRRARLRAGRRRHHAGPLTICITVFGEVPPGQALLRDGARAGDDLWVSQARSATRAWRSRCCAARVALRRRCVRARAPRDGAAAAARGARAGAARHRQRGDRRLSDGLFGDLGHVLRALARRRRRSRPTRCRAARAGRAAARRCSATACSAGGDDYELLFTAPASARAARRSALPTRAGVAVDAHRPRRGRSRAARASTPDGRVDARPARGFDHFAADDRAMSTLPLPPVDRLRAAPRRPALPARAPGASDRARLRQRPGAGARPAPSARCGPGSPSSCCSRWLDDWHMGACCSRCRSLLGWWACTATARRPAPGRPGRDRLGRGRRVLARAVAGHAGRLLGPVGGVRAVPLLRRRQAGPGGLGRPLVQGARRRQPIGWRARASASCSTTWWRRSARCS